MDACDRPISWTAYRLTEVVALGGERLRYELAGHVLSPSLEVGELVRLPDGHTAQVVWVAPLRHHIGIEYADAPRLLGRRL